MELVLTLSIVIGATAVIFNLGRLAKRLPFSVSSLAYINTLSKYQALLLGVATLVLLALYFVNQANFATFLAPGNIAAPANGVSWLGIPNGESWLRLGAKLSLFTTLATTTFVYLQLRRSGGSLRQLLVFFPWVLLFSLTNSFSEEVVYRLGVIVPLAGSVDNTYLLLFSAIAFGAPHLRGMPNGLVGA